MWTFNTSTGSGIPYEAQNKNDPTKIEKGDAVTPDGLFHRRPASGRRAGGRVTSARSTARSTSAAASPIHGMTSVPNHPASHGCVRLSTRAMDFIWDQNLMPLRITVWVHS